MAAPEKTVPVEATAARTATPAPTRREFPSFLDLRREVESLFDDFGRGWFAPGRRLAALDPFRAAPTPAVDVEEVDGAFRITAELPGLDETAVKVTVAGDTLTIAGEKTETRDENSEGVHLSERRYGSFARSFTLPEGTPTDAITAGFANGVLTVTVPKPAVAAAETKTIEVKAA